MELRELVAREAAKAILAQDLIDGDGLEADLRIDYLDQGITDFGLVADAILALPEMDPVFPLREQIKRREARAVRKGSTIDPKVVENGG